MARTSWAKLLHRVAFPVLDALANGRLKRTLPIEHHPDSTDRAQFTYLEALGRTLTGLAPWLELDPAQLDAQERRPQQELRRLVPEALAVGLDPDSPDFLNFTTGQQPIVDAAFLAHALLRAPTLFAGIPARTRDRLVDALRVTRTRKPGFSNWLLFAAMTEAALFVLTGECDRMRVDFALRQHDAWYLGGGMYSDGPDFHADYYNSFVIQPMLIDVLRTVGHLDRAWSELLPRVLTRARRHGQMLARMIAPDGSYPAIGRSIAYRCGAFQLLGQLALQRELPEDLPPAQVRGALTAVIDRTLRGRGNFDAQGFLRIGLAGHQPSLGEIYISTGSLYLCTAAFLPLGLPPDDAFWSDPDDPFPGQRIWSGQDMPADHD